LGFHLDRKHRSPLHARSIRYVRRRRGAARKV